MRERAAYSLGNIGDEAKAFFWSHNARFANVIDERILAINAAKPLTPEVAAQICTARYVTGATPTILLAHSSESSSTR